MRQERTRQMSTLETTNPPTTPGVNFFHYLTRGETDPVCYLTGPNSAKLSWYESIITVKDVLPLVHNGVEHLQKLLQSRI